MKIEAIYTFGSPRILNPEAACYAEISLFPNRIFRHVHYGDVVPLLPLKHSPDLGPQEVFDHSGLIALLDSQGEIRFGPGPWSRARPSLLRSLSELPIREARAFAAHRPSVYHTLLYEQYRQSRRSRPNGWNPSVALACIRASQLPYEGFLGGGLPPLGIRETRLVAGRSVEALVVVPDRIEATPFRIVAFRSRGRKSVDPEGRSLWRHLVGRRQETGAPHQAPWYPEAPGAAHGVWLSEIAEIEGTLHDALRRISPDLPILATGHSKGGAQALLWAMRFAEKSRDTSSKLRGRTPEDAGNETIRTLPPARDLPWTPSAPTWEGHPPLSYQEIGRRVRELRESRDVTQAELAAHIGHEQSQVSRIETGESRVRIDDLLAILAVFDVSVAHFFDEERREPVTPGDLQMIMDLRTLSEEDRSAVESLVRFKLRKEEYKEE